MDCLHLFTFDIKDILPYNICIYIYIFLAALRFTLDGGRQVVKLAPTYI